MEVYFANLGCARNQVDSEIMCQQLRLSGLELVNDPETAETIVVNTCSFIESAAQESIDTILELAAYKHKGNCRRLIVVGCLVQRYGEQIVKALPEVDIFLGTGGFDRLSEALSGALAPGACLLPDPATREAVSFPARRPFNPRQVYLKIAEGCDRHCTYCIIPRLRGPQRSLDHETLKAEAEALIEQGAGEITLVAQETTAWGRDLDPPQTFASLLATLAAIDPAVWVRFFYGHPASFDLSIIHTLKSHPNLCPYFDLPIQHASDPVLRAMGRNYRRRDLETLFGAIRQQIPRAALRTTVIVGFPGETDRDFESLEDFIRQTAFDHLGVFIYSDADDLASHRLKDHVPRKLALERHNRLMEIQQQISARLNRRHLGRRYPVLIESRSEDNLYIGRTMFQGPEVDGLTFVRSLSGMPLEPGRMVNVRISDTLEYDLVGEAP